MDHQDWKSIVIHKKEKKESNKPIIVKSTETKLEFDIEEGNLSHKKMDVNFGKSLQKFRLNKNLTQKDLAKKLNIPSKDINEIESGKMKHNGQIMGKIKNIMNKS